MCQWLFRLPVAITFHVSVFCSCAHVEITSLFCYVHVYILLYVFMSVSGQLPPRNIARRLGIGFGLALVSGLGLCVCGGGGGQFSSASIVLEPFISINFDVLHDLVPFIQFKKREKRSWRSLTFNKVTLPHECFSRFLNCTNGTKSRNALCTYIYLEFKFS